MGLDTVELVMEVEESFDISISDDAAQQIITVGDLFEFVKSQTERAPALTCLSAATFDDVQRALRSHGIAERFGPSTNLADVIPRTGRRSFWRSLASSLQLRLPNLQRSTPVSYASIFVTLTLALVCATLTPGGTQSVGTFFIAALFSAIVLAVVTSYATRPLATHFGAGFETFRGLSERILAMNATEQKLKHGPMGPNDIWVILRELIAEQLGVDRDEVIPSARFVKDLGCN